MRMHRRGIGTEEGCGRMREGSGGVVEGVKVLED